MKICVAVPLHNAEKWLDQMEVFPEYEYRFFDNASTDETRKILEKRGFQYACSDTKLSRIDSWLSCFDFASVSSSDWIKPLFSGDTLASGLSAIALLDREIGFILLNYEIEKSGRRIRRARRWNTSGDFIRDAAYFGPFTGPPLAFLFTKEAYINARSDLTLAFSDWLADFQFFSIIVKKCRYTQVNLSAGIYRSARRLTYMKFRKDIEYLAEELDLMRENRLKLEKLGTIGRIRISTRIIDLALHRGFKIVSFKVMRSSLKELWC